MKTFSIVITCIATLIVGTFFITVLPHYAKLNSSSSEGSPLDEIVKTEPTKKEDFILRDKCNSVVLSKSFENSQLADDFLSRCLEGKETSSINVIKPNGSSLGTSTDTAKVVLTEEEKISKCNDFMAHATFSDKKSADLFLKQCLSSK